MTSFKGVCQNCGFIYKEAPSSIPAGCTECWSKSVTHCQDGLKSSGPSEPIDEIGKDVGVGLERWYKVNKFWRPDSVASFGYEANAPDSPSIDHDSSVDRLSNWPNMNHQQFSAIFNVVSNDDTLPADLPTRIPLALAVEACIAKWEEDE
eukprot:NODE_7811_length_739_cov_33.021104_g7197_i0.p1 GENE.NODE_7811_length_739_cov_33.021104_g7197_i0~~NODE_7811_length_739_cov_33.021104_g7197_i0.p1  ORF type:complete len:150 (-),score=32.07 NODE_7811_length_739_cov_33.021104_g7197_i0:207-656(-)